MPEKTEPPTQRRREEVRQKGQVARSVEVNSAAILLVGIFLARPLGGGAYQQLAELARKAFTSLPTEELAFVDLQAHGLTLGFVAVKALAPMLLAFFVVGALVNLAQVGVLFSFEPLKPSPSRINPLEGLKRIFSKRGIVELVKALAKVAVIGYFAFSTIKGQYAQILGLPRLGVSEGLGMLGQVGMSLGMKSAAAVLVLSVLDYAFQRREFEKSIWMTKQELMEELRRAEGDPLFKARMRGQRRRFLMQRMMQQVPEADVVVTNPVHLAVALKYDPDGMAAPVVIAKGQRLLAEQIRKIARQHGIPIIRNRPLAQALFKTVEIGMQIPATLYRAVAEVLAFVYRLRERTA